MFASQRVGIWTQDSYDWLDLIDWVVFPKQPQNNHVLLDAHLDEVVLVWFIVLREIEGVLFRSWYY